MRRLLSGRTIPVALAVTLLGHGHAFGGEPPTESAANIEGTPAQLDAFELRVVGDPSRLATLRQSLDRGELNSVELRWSLITQFDPQELLEVAPAPRPKPERTYLCWVDLRNPEMARLYFADPAHERFMLRELALNQRWGSFEVESVAQVLELSILALRSDNEAGMTRRQVQAALAAQPTDATSNVSAPTPAPPPRATVQLHILSSVAWRFRAYSSELPLVMGPDLALGVVRNNRHRLLRAELSLGHDLARTLQSEVASSTISTWLLRLRVEVLASLDSQGRTWLGPHLATGFDVINAVPHIGSASFPEYTFDERSDWTVVFAPGITWSISISDHVALRFQGSLDLTPKPIEHVFLVDDRKLPVTTTWHVRPSVSIGAIAF